MKNICHNFYRKIIFNASALYNGINSYCMLRFSYRLNVFGNKEARGNMRHGGFDGGGPRGPRGGFGGGRPH